MTSAPTWEPVPTGGWTTDDLDKLPDDGVRRELIDGVIVVSPSPTHAHQSIVWRLSAALDRICPPEYEATQGVEVRISARRALIPDVLVVRAEAARANPPRFAAYDVVIAVEIISPSSETMDRFAKPALYAAANIPFYWVVEADGRAVTVVTHRLDATQERYAPTGRFSDQIILTQPWDIKLPISTFLPPCSLERC